MKAKRLMEKNKRTSRHESGPVESSREAGVTIVPATTLHRGAIATSLFREETAEGSIVDGRPPPILHVGQRKAEAVAVRPSLFPCLTSLLTNDMDRSELLHKTPRRPYKSGRRMRQETVCHLRCSFPRSKVHIPHFGSYEKNECGWMPVIKGSSLQSA